MGGVAGFALVVLFILLDVSIAHSQRRNRLGYITTISNLEIDTPSSRAHPHSYFDLSFSLHDGDQDVKLSLEPNTDIIASDAVVEYMDENGNLERREPLRKSWYRFYKGSAWLRDEKGWYWAGWARIVVTRDGIDPLVQGAFTLDHDAHHIHLHSSYMKTRHEQDPILEDAGDEVMVVFRDSDVDKGIPEQGLYRRRVSNDHLCPSDSLGFNTQPENPINKMIIEGSKSNWGSLSLDTLLGGRRFGGGLTKRQSMYGSDIHGGVGNSAGVYLRDTIGRTDGCPKTRQVALLGVATDCTYMGDFSDEDEARQNIIQQINSASVLYENAFNITLGLSQLVISKAECPATPPESAQWNAPCSANVTIEDRLHSFSVWRGQRSGDGIAVWLLMTTCETGASVGLAWLGQLCKSDVTLTSDQQSVTGVVVVAKTSSEWKVVAHEIGHSMGAVHDCIPETCSDGSETASMCCPLSSKACDANGEYIMNPSTTLQMQQFSPCTVGNICSAFLMKSVNISCLVSNRNVTILSEKECGNGIVEEGEQCDCGGASGCVGNKCCDGSTCKFKNNAVCDDYNEICCTGCQFSPSSKVCRPSSGECDPQETCVGNSSACPIDITSPDGKSCGNGSLKCASGQCTSRDQQCKSVMGPIASSNDTASCDNSSCVLTCQSPALGANVCLQMQQNFLDGTPCDGNGMCQNGRCTGATALGPVTSWISSHRNIVIGVAAGFAAMILFSICSCCLSRFRQRSRGKGQALQWQQVPSRGPGDGVTVYPAPPPHLPRPSMAASQDYPAYHQAQLPRYA